MDGSKLETLDAVRGKLTKATALAIMGEMRRKAIRAVIGRFFELMQFFFNSNEKNFLHSFPAGDKLWWADQGTDQIGTCDKKDGGNWRVMRNNTSPMMHMRIYDEEVQKGEKHVAGCILL